MELQWTYERRLGCSGSAGLEGDDGRALRLEQLQHALQLRFLNGLGQHEAAVALEICAQLGVIAIAEEDEAADPRVHTLAQLDPVEAGSVQGAEGRVEAHSMRQVEAGIGI